MGMKPGRTRRLLAVVGVLAALLLVVIVVMTVSWAESRPGVPPEVTGFSPQGTVSNLSAEIYIEFNERMNKKSVEDAFSLSTNGQDIPCTPYWDTEGTGDTAVWFTPVSQLSDGKEYLVNINASAQTAAGVKISKPLSWKFSTPSLAQTLYAILPVIVIPALFLSLIFLYLEYSYYGSWAGRMKKRYGGKFDEMNYDFFPLFRRRKRPEKGLLLEKGAWGAIYDNGIRANFIYEKHKSIRHEYKGYSEIEAVYPISFDDLYSRTKKKMYDGIQIETRDLKVCLFNSRIHPLKELMPQLVAEFGDRWDKVYRQDEPLSPKKMGIHHYLMEGKK